MKALSRLCSISVHMMIPTILNIFSMNNSMQDILVDPNVRSNRSRAIAVRFLLQCVSKDRGRHGPSPPPAALSLSRRKLHPFAVFATDLK
mgnify:CR=1 FL=1